MAHPIKIIVSFIVIFYPAEVEINKMNEIERIYL